MPQAEALTSIFVSHRFPACRYRVIAYRFASSVSYPPARVGIGDSPCHFILQTDVVPPAMPLNFPSLAPLGNRRTRHIVLRFTFASFVDSTLHSTPMLESSDARLRRNLPSFRPRTWPSVCRCGPAMSLWVADSKRARCSDSLPRRPAEALVIATLPRSMSPSPHQDIDVATSLLISGCLSQNRLANLSTGALGLDRPECHTLTVLEDASRHAISLG